MIDIGMSPYMHGYEAHMWTVELARHHMNKKFKTGYTYGGAYSVLRSLNIVAKTPRPANPKGLSPEEQPWAVPTWSGGRTEYTVSVNISGNRGYQSTVPMPVMEKLGRPDSIAFRVRGNEIVVVRGPDEGRGRGARAAQGGASAAGGACRPCRRPSRAFGRLMPPPRPRLRPL